MLQLTSRSDSSRRARTWCSKANGMVRPSSRLDFLVGLSTVLSAVTLGVTATAALALPVSSSGETIMAALPATATTEGNTVCQNGALVGESAVPGAYSSICMGEPERIVPLPRLQGRLDESERTTRGTIVIQQQTGGGGQTGMTVWNSGLLLTRLIDALVTELGSKDFWSQQEVLELGSGAGLCSIAAHKLGAKSVLATDGNPLVLELAKANIQRNCGTTDNGSIQATVLQWGLLNAMDFSETASLVLGADLTYNAGSWRVLAETMSTVLKTDGDARVLYLSLGHEGFNVNAEMDGFLSVAKEVGLVSAPELEGIDVNNLMQSLFTNQERKVIEQSGGARVVVLKRKTFQSWNSKAVNQY
mmetsp:Transcript_32911/g.55156  ORF Transcript_32911/g.55156 Transcript_32911/m.55156 type:complete len:360 (-) Transcript_32911:1276-2355(-)